MYDGGASLKSIARLVGISKQAVLAIAKRGSDGFVRNRKQKGSHPNPPEIWVKERLEVLGYSPKYSGYNGECDLTLGKKRIEVKHRKNGVLRGKHRYYSFSPLYKRNADIFVLMVGEIGKHDTYIYKTEDIKAKSIQIAVKRVFKNSKHDKFKEKWSVFSEDT